MNIEIQTGMYASLDNVYDSGNGPVYRYEQLLNFNNPYGDKVIIDSGSTLFALTAVPLIVNLLSADPAIGLIETTVQGDYLIFTLPRPYLLAHIKLSSALAAKNKAAIAQSKKSNQISAVSQVTANESLGVLGFSFPGYSVPMPIKVYRVDIDTVANSPTLALQSQQEIKDFVADKFALRLLDSKGQAKTITANKFSHVSVESRPTGLRAGIQDSNGKIDFFWRKAGDVNKILIDDEANTNTSKSLVSALERALSFGSEQILLVIESDTPCKIKIEQFSLSYLLYRNCIFDQQAVAGSNEKWVADFKGTEQERHEFTSAIPVSNQVENVFLETLESFVPAALYPAIPDGVIPDLKNNEFGISLFSQHSAALQFRPLNSLLLKGVMLAVIPLSNKSRFTVEVKKDFQGKPEGDVVAYTEVEGNESGVKQWLNVQFSKQHTIFNEPNWIQIKVTEGALVWITHVSPTDKMFIKTLHGSQNFPETSNAVQKIPMTLLCVVPQSHTPARASVSIAVNGEVVTMPPLDLGQGSYRYNLTSEFQSNSQAPNIKLTLISTQRGKAYFNSLFYSYSL